MRKPRPAKRKTRRKANHHPRAKKWFEDRGCLVDICQRRDGFRSVLDEDLTEKVGRKVWNRFPGQSHDLHGLADLHVLIPCTGSLFVQVTSLTNLWSHKVKAVDGRSLEVLLGIPNHRFIIMAYYKPKNLWVPRFWVARVNSGGDIIFKEVDSDELAIVLGASWSVPGRTT
jgi:hypothetical protein